MKKFICLLAIAFIATTLFTSCESVGSKERGVEVSWGGEVNMNKIYDSGMYVSPGWLFDDIINYDVSQKTEVEKFSFNDKNNMVTGVEVAVDFSLDPKKVPYLHTKITDWEIKLKKTIKSAAKEVIPQYTASELNLNKRQEAEDKLEVILRRELPEFYLMFDRVQLTDVDIPEGIAQAAEQTAKQAELNKLSESKVTDSKNKLDAAKYDAEAKAILSKPEMLALKRLEVEMEWAKQGVSPYGNNNMFGVGTGVLINKK